MTSLRITAAFFPCAPNFGHYDTLLVPRWSDSEAERSCWPGTRVVTRYNYNNAREGARIERDTCLPVLCGPARNIEIMTSSKTADRSPHDEEARKTGAASRPILDYQLLAKRWCVSPRTIINMRSRDPASLPATIRPPGARGPRWRLQDVEAFEQRLRDTAMHRPSSPIILAAQKRAEEEG